MSINSLGEERTINSQRQTILTNIPPYLRSVRVITAQHGPTGRLDQKASHIGPHKNAREKPSLELPDRSLGKPEIHHSAPDHVREGIDPERRKQNQHIRDLRPRVVPRFLCAHAAQAQPGSLPDCGHADDPGETLFVIDGLG